MEEDSDEDYASYFLPNGIADDSPPKRSLSPSFGPIGGPTSSFSLNFKGLAARDDSATHRQQPPPHQTATHARAKAQLQSPRCERQHQLQPKLEESAFGFLDADRHTGAVQGGGVTSASSTAHRRNFLLSELGGRVHEPSFSDYGLGYDRVDASKRFTGNTMPSRTESSLTGNFGSQTTPPEPPGFGSTFGIGSGGDSFGLGGSSRGFYGRPVANPLAQKLAANASQSQSAADASSTETPFYHGWNENPRRVLHSPPGLRRPVSIATTSSRMPSDPTQDRDLRAEMTTSGFIGSPHGTSRFPSARRFPQDSPFHSPSTLSSSPNERNPVTISPHISLSGSQIPQVNTDLAELNAKSVAIERASSKRNLPEPTRSSTPTHASHNSNNNNNSNSRDTFKSPNQPEKGKPRGSQETAGGDGKSRGRETSARRVRTPTKAKPSPSRKKHVSNTETDTNGQPSTEPNARAGTSTPPGLVHTRYSDVVARKKTPPPTQVKSPTRSQSGDDSPKSLTSDRRSTLKTPNTRGESRRQTNARNNDQDADASSPASSPPDDAKKSKSEEESVNARAGVVAKRVVSRRQVYREKQQRPSRTRDELVKKENEVKDSLDVTSETPSKLPKKKTQNSAMVTRIRAATSGSNVGGGSDGNVPRAPASGPNARTIASASETTVAPASAPTPVASSSPFKPSSSVGSRKEKKTNSVSEQSDREARLKVIHSKGVARETDESTRSQSAAPQEQSWHTTETIKQEKPRKQQDEKTTPPPASPKSSSGEGEANSMKSKDSQDGDTSQEEQAQLSEASSDQQKSVAAKEKDSGMVLGRKERKRKPKKEKKEPTSAKKKSTQEGAAPLSSSSDKPQGSFADQAGSKTTTTASLERKDDENASSGETSVASAFAWNLLLLTTSFGLKLATLGITNLKKLLLANYLQMETVFSALCSALLFVCFHGGAWFFHIHRVAFRTILVHRHIGFCFAFLYAFPYLVQYVIPWAPPWAPVCLWYAFLVQLFCTNGPTAMVTTFRILLPLVFLVEGVSHHSFLLDLNGSERVMTSFILSALKTSNVTNPIFLCSLAAQSFSSIFLGSEPFLQWFQAAMALCNLASIATPYDEWNDFYEPEEEAFNNSHHSIAAFNNFHPLPLASSVQRTKRLDRRALATAKGRKFR